MNDVNLENKLILVDIVDKMQDYVGLQPDIDEQKVKAATTIAQRIDIKRIIGKDNLQRCIEPTNDEDDELRNLIIPPLCYYTYYRLLKGFQGSYTESGYTNEELATNRDEAKAVANEMYEVAGVFMKDVLDFLSKENPDGECEQSKKLTPKISVFGGKERRASN